MGGAMRRIVCWFRGHDWTEYEVRGWFVRECRRCIKRVIQ